MRKFSLIILLAFCFLSLRVLALDIPAKPMGRISDYVNLLSPETHRAIEKNLADFERTIGPQITVAIFDSLQGEKLESFSLRLANMWGIGHVGKNDGILLLITKQDHFLRIEVGKGVNQKLTDGRAAQILNENIIPHFRKQEFDQGVLDGVAAIQKVLMP